MSADTDTTDDTGEQDEATREVSFEEGRRQTRQYANLTRTYVAELPDGGTWTFKYQMLDDEEALVDEHTTVQKGRSGVEEDTDFEALRFDAFCQGVVDAPEGFPLSPTKLKNEDALIKKIVKEVADQIIDFTSADDETIREFR